jgi:hypothetical protein
LGLILYAIYTSPVFDVGKLWAFADDSFIPRWGKSLLDLIKDMKEELLAEITKWLRQSGLKINHEKTELCLFRLDVAPVRIIISKNLMNVQG